MANRFASSEEPHVELKSSVRAIVVSTKIEQNVSNTLRLMDGDGAGGDCKTFNPSTLPDSGFRIKLQGVSTL